MKRAYTNGILLDGTEQMQPVAHKILLTEDDKITAIADEGVDLDGYEVIDLHGSYIMPGLVNLHVHLAGNGKPSAKPRDNAALVRKILSNGLTRAVAYRMVCSYAKLELLGGVTTIRTVGGIADFDTRCRDDAAAGRLLAPRILAANEGISVPGGHMAGSVAVAAHNNAEALAQLRKASGQKVDLVKLMITGGVMDAALRSAYYLVTGQNPDPDAFRDVRGMDGWKEAKFDIPGAGPVSVAVASGLLNTRKLMTALERGEVRYDFVEIMACPGGCAGGGGQPIHDGVELAEKRGSVLWNIDKAAPSRFSHENPEVHELYREYMKKPLSDVSHHLLHTDHQAWKMPSQK